jgi:hypothetical protein
MVTGKESSHVAVIMIMTIDYDDNTSKLLLLLLLLMNE